MKHIPIMLALALSISLTSYDGSTTTGTTNTTITEATSVTANTINTNDLSEVLTAKFEGELEDKL